MVLASRQESFGRVLLEALALETPVVAPDLGGPAEIVGRSERGFLFRSDDADSLAVTLEEALSQPEIARERARLGREWVSIMCSPERHAVSIQRLWEQAAQISRKP